MCTYDGVSDNTEDNSTIGDNAQYYPYGNVDNVDETFWMQLINEYEMNLCVNNSWSGSKVLDTDIAAAGYNTRPEQLHNNDGTNPEIIVSFMGNNDFTAGKTAGTINEDLFTTIESYVDNGTEYVPTTFAEGYTMMVYKMAKKYPNAKILLFNMALRTETPSDLLLAYNNIIETVASHYGCYIVDLTNSIMSGTNYNSYTVGDNLHPNEAGMDVWTNLCIDALKEAYLTQE